MRVEGYLSKKAKRTFEKKIVYTTRKRVADRRIRFKGKFINEYQARELPETLIYQIVLSKQS